MWYLYFDSPEPQERGGIFMPSAPPPSPHSALLERLPCLSRGRGIIRKSFGQNPRDESLELLVGQVLDLDLARQIPRGLWICPGEHPSAEH